MKQVPLSFRIIKMDNRENILCHLEKIGRVCYKSEDKITPDSASKFVRMLVKRGHHAMIEHASISVGIVCNRGVTHEQVRHRLAAYAQESTRYCNYSKGKFTGEITVIKTPDIIKDEDLYLFEYPQRVAEEYYMKLIEKGYKAEIARNILPINLKADIVVTANLREWLHIFKMRCDKAAHLQIREVMGGIEKVFQKNLPEVFGELKEVTFRHSLEVLKEQGGSCVGIVCSNCYFSVDNGGPCTNNRGQNFANRDNVHKLACDLLDEEVK